MRTSRLATLGWIATATIVLLYAPMAAEYTARLFTDDAPQLWDHTYAGVVGERQVYGVGSIHVVEGDNYLRYRTVLLVHTVIGAIAISLAVFQLSRRSRRKIGIHRWVGRAQGSLVVISMTTGMAYLLLIGPQATFDGPAFYLQLWALAIGTLAGTLLGWFAVRRGHQSSHRVLMTYAFALLCTAPFLRVGYLLFGLAWPDSTQLVTNMASAAVLAVWAPMGAAVAARTIPASRHRDHIAPLPGRVADRSVLSAAAVGAAALTIAYVAAFDGLDRITVTAIASNVLGLLLTGLNVRSAAQADSELAHEEWRIHHTAMLAGIPMTGLLWLAYDLPFTTEQAFYGAVLTGPAVTLSTGIALIAWRRRRPARRSSDAVLVA